MVCPSCGKEVERKDIKDWIQIDVKGLCKCGRMIVFVNDAFRYNYGLKKSDSKPHIIDMHGSIS